MDFQENTHVVLVDPAFAQDEQSFITQVFGWMGVALSISAIAAYYVGNTDYFINLIFGNILIFYGLLILELLMVAYLSGMIKKMSLNSARVIFVFYSLLNGVTLSVIFLIYTTASIVTTFAVTAGVFAAMALYGYYTKRDLSSWGSLLFMLLLGLILASVVNLFWFSEKLDWIITYAGIFIFVGLTAYDMQKIKIMNKTFDPSNAEDKKEAIMGALVLYLDFINLFLKFLRIFGKKK